MSFLPPHYCLNLHAGLQLALAPNGEINVSPCPMPHETIPLGSHKAFDHPRLIELRTTNIQNKELEGFCAKCDTRYNDSALICSNRSSTNEFYIKDKLLYNQSGPKQITFKLNYVCNLACVTCGPELSSKWRVEKKIKGGTLSTDKDYLRNTIRNINLENLETVHIFGGEPFLTDTHEVILEELTPFAKNITVWYDTNGTVLPSQRVMDLWEPFHLIRLKFSIDGIGDSFNYLRWPGDWPSTQDKILTMVETLPYNHMFSVRPAIGFLNFHIIKEIRDWQQKYLKTNRMGDNTEFEYNPVFGLFKAQNITQAMKDDLLALYSKDDPINIVMPKLVVGNNQILNDIKQTLIALDSIRKLDYTKSLPHLVKYLQ